MGNKGGKSKKSNAKLGSTEKRNNNKNLYREKYNGSDLTPQMEVTLIVILVVCILLFISNFGIGGTVGDFFSSIMFGAFGILAFVFPVLVLLAVWFAFGNRHNKTAYLKLLFAFLMTVSLSTFCSLCYNGEKAITPLAGYVISSKTHSGGGGLGTLFTSFLVPNLGMAGAYIVDVGLFLISGVLLFEKSFIGFIKQNSKRATDTGLKAISEHSERRRREKTEVSDYRDTEETTAKTLRKERKVSGVAYDTKINALPLQSQNMSELHSPEGSISFTDHAYQGSEKTKEPIEHSQSLETKTRKAKASKTKEADEEIQEIMASYNNYNPENSEKYTFPPINLLKAGSGRVVGSNDAELKETAMKLEETLRTFGVGARVTEVTSGPSVTRYEISPDMGVKVSKIVALADDIKLNLAAADIRIEAPIPGKAAVGIEVPNKENVMVPFRDLIDSPEFASAKTKIPFSAGRDIAGKVIIHDIAKMPHVLIAGATGSGKSVCINTIVMSILYKARPDEVKLIMIDPKVVELSVYNGIPHLLIPVVTDPKKASGALTWAVNEMTDRYQKFAEAEVRDLAGYNEKAKAALKEDKESPMKPMPQIIIIVDELADLMMVCPGEVEDSICRLAQLARACGIHLVLATQRPSVNVITGLIKANMPSRVAFAVSSGVDSRTILDMNGAEKLLGKGDMLFYPQGYQKPLRVQGAFVSDEEVSKVVEFVKNNTPKQDEEESKAILEKVNAHSISGNSIFTTPGAATDDGRDVLFGDAGRFLIEKEKGSIGVLQRQFKIGFNRAARIMDQLCEAGVVGAEEGTKPRKVLMTLDEFNAMMDEE